MVGRMVIEEGRKVDKKGGRNKKKRKEGRKDRKKGGRRERMKEEKKEERKEGRKEEEARKRQKKRKKFVFLLYIKLLQLFFCFSQYIVHIIHIF